METARAEYTLNFEFTTTDAANVFVQYTPDDGEYLVWKNSMDLTCVVVTYCAYGNVDHLRIDKNPSTGYFIVPNGSEYNSIDVCVSCLSFASTYNPDNPYLILASD